MITPPFSISARPVLTRKVARSAMGPHSRREPCLPRCGLGNLVRTSPAQTVASVRLGAPTTAGRWRFTTWGPSPGPRYRLQVRIAPRACSYAVSQPRRRSAHPHGSAADESEPELLQLEGAHPVPVGCLVTGIDPVGECLDQAHQRRVRADVGRSV